MKKKDHYRQQFYSGQYDVNALRVRHGHRPTLDGNFPHWYVDLKADQATFSLPFLTLKDSYHGISSLGLTTECKCNEGWADYLYRHSGSPMANSGGEVKAVDLTTTERWKDNARKNALTRYRPSDIFYVGETGLFWRLLPDKTMTLRSEKCQGGQRAKDRLTVFFCTNMDGSEKWPLLVVGKFQTPNCFKGLKTLPTKYSANSKAWMSQDLFLSWLHEFDLAMIRQQRKALLVLDNCSVHPIPSYLQATELLYLPFKSTSKPQRFDVGRAFNLKTHYRSALLSRLQVHVNQGLNLKDFTLSLLDALNMLSISWTKVTPQTVQNSFRLIGFDGYIGGNGLDSENYWQDLSYLKLQIPKLCEDMGLSLTTEDIVSVDENVATCPMETVDILMTIPMSASLEKDEEDDLGDESPEVTRAEAVSSVRKVLLFLLQRGCSDEISDLFTRLQVALEAFQINV